jgi:hypothetical protein
LEVLAPKNRQVITEFGAVLCCVKVINEASFANFTAITNCIGKSKVFAPINRKSNILYTYHNEYTAYTG